MSDKADMRGTRLAGKVALVTGVGSGIGRGCAMMFARQGAAVMGCDLNVAAAEATATAARAENLHFEQVGPCDVTDPGPVTELIDFTIARHGGIDILLNAAATAVFAWIEDLTYQDWRRTLTAELDSVFLMCKAAWPHLIARGGGAIINFASANAYMALEGSAALAHCAGKDGVLAMTRQLAMEGGPHKIRANTISPGLIVTASTERHMKETPGIAEKALAKKMIKRLGRPEDVAWCATYLASDEASWVTAADFSIDGGASSW